MSMRFSTRLAVLIGIATPSIEVVRRWQELRSLTVWWPAFFDDILLGAFLLYAAWRTTQNGPSGRPVLTAAWAFMCGIAYSSVFIQLANLSQPDPSGLSPTLVVFVKAVGLALGILGLISAFGVPGVRPPHVEADERVEVSGAG
jgi:hypothetical protein